MSVILMYLICHLQKGILLSLCNIFSDVVGLGKMPQSADVELLYDLEFREKLSYLLFLVHHYFQFSNRFGSMPGPNFVALLNTKLGT